jgi:hypothetical protein
MLVGILLVAILVAVCLVLWAVAAVRDELGNVAGHLSVLVGTAETANRTGNDQFRVLSMIRNQLEPLEPAPVKAPIKKAPTKRAPAKR